MIQYEGDHWVTNRSRLSQNSSPLVLGLVGLLDTRSNWSPQAPVLIPMHPFAISPPASTRDITDSSDSYELNGSQTSQSLVTHYTTIISLPAAAATPQCHRKAHVTETPRTWLLSHANLSYPAEEKEKVLCSTTSLTLGQVSNWMINILHGFLFTVSKKQITLDATASPYLTSITRLLTDADLALINHQSMSTPDPIPPTHTAPPPATDTYSSAYNFPQLSRNPPTSSNIESTGRKRCRKEYRGDDWGKGFTRGHQLDYHILQVHLGMPPVNSRVAWSWHHFKNDATPATPSQVFAHCSFQHYCLP
ncbi:hypothetical protein B0J17DRAFT_411897 [Rhizoctonia solani]|nr:hypothetical protein B0J17DRAFT_411897 [Rhizoctonia solani]